MKLNFLDIIFLIALAPWVIKPILSGNLSSGFSKLYVTIIAAYLTFFWHSSALVTNLISTFVAGQTAIKFVSIIFTFVAFYILINLLLFLLDLVIGAISIAFLDKIIAGILGFLAGISFLFLAIFFLDSFESFKKAGFWNSSSGVKIARKLDHRLNLQNKIQNINKEQKKIRSQFD